MARASRSNRRKRSSSRSVRCDSTFSASRRPSRTSSAEPGHPAGSERLEDSIVRQHVAGGEHPLHAFTARVPPRIVTTAAASAVERETALVAVLSVTNPRRALSRVRRIMKDE